MFSIEYALRQDFPNQLVTLVLVTIVFLFFPKKYRESFPLLILIPAFVGSFFPDVSYVILTYGLHSNYHTISHSMSFLLITIPIAQVLVYLVSKIFKKDLPNQWIMIVATTALVSSWIHLIVDKLGY